MDFEMHYTEEQEEFRKEVRAWLSANTRPDMKKPVDEAKVPRELFDYGRELRRKLGQKGWLAPMYPKEYGGGGLTVEKAVIISEEMAELDVYQPYDGGMGLVAPAVMVWGTDDQKQRLLPPILKGERITWQCFTEPEAGTDLASLKMRADKDGEDFILNGQKTFIGSNYDVEWLYTLAVTDQSKPRHQNIGAFIVPADAPGITIQPLTVIANHQKHNVFYDDVRVSRRQLIGGETDGWRVAQSSLEIEHGGSGSAGRRDRFLDKLIEYCRETKRNGQPLSKDPDVREAIVDIYIGSQVLRLFGMRNYWMRTSRVQWAWEGSQNSLYGKLRMPRVAQQVLNILGPYALITDPKFVPMGGEFENQQRTSILTHPGGTPEAQKIVMARRIGIAKTRQTAAAIV